MNFIKRLFAALVPRRNEQAGPDIPIPRPGESWIFDNSDGSPWPREPGPIVTVRDVRDGWVRFDMGGEWDDNRTTLKTFCALYRPYGTGKAQAVAGSQDQKLDI